MTYSALVLRRKGKNQHSGLALGWEKRNDLQAVPAVVGLFGQRTVGAYLLYNGPASWCDAETKILFW